MELHKAESDSLGETLKVSWKEVAAILSLVEEQRTLLGAAVAQMVELKNCSNHASASTATGRKELLQVHNNLEAALEKVKASSACAVAMTKGRDVMSTKYEEQRSSIEERVCYANREMSRLEAEAIKVTEEREKGRAGVA